MCWPPEFDGFVRNQHLLSIRDFYVKCRGIKIPKKKLPVALTLLFPPRSEETELSIDGSKVSPGHSAFATLHIATSSSEGEAVFRSHQAVVASGELPFEILFDYGRFIGGSFRRSKDGDWGLSIISYSNSKELEVSRVAEVRVVLENHASLSNRLRIMHSAGSGTRAVVKQLSELEVILEEDDELDDCWKKHCLESVGECDKSCWELEMDCGNGSWAVEMGVWAVFLGLGFMVSRASTRRLFGRPWRC